MIYRLDKKWLNWDIKSKISESCNPEHRTNQNAKH